MKSVSLLVLLTLAASLGLPSVARASLRERIRSCVSAFHLFGDGPDKAKSVSPKSLDPSTTVDKFLSEGYSAHTYLATDPNSSQNVFVKKIYKSDKFGDLRYHYDVEGLNALKALNSILPNSFLVVTGERYMEPAISQDDAPRPAVKLSFVQGRTVHALLLDSAVTPEMKASISTLYTQKLATLKKAMDESKDVKGKAALKAAEQRYFFDGVIDALPMMTAELTEGGLILIKTDNVIVDPLDATKMTIIDPY